MTPKDRINRRYAKKSPCARPAPAENPPDFKRESRSLWPNTALTATAEMGATSHTVFNAARVLDVVVRNKYLKNPAMLAAWTPPPASPNAPAHRLNYG